jgi:hypothetical protein
MDEARQKALENCRKATQNKETCTVVYVDDTQVQ